MASTVRSVRAVFIVPGFDFRHPTVVGGAIHRRTDGKSAAPFYACGMRPGSPPQAMQGVELWPRTTVFVEALIATVLAVAVALEDRPGWSVGARVVVAAIPAALWWSCALPRKLPFLLRAALTIGAVTVLVWHPAELDLAPFFLVLLIGEAAFVAPMWQGVVVTIASAGMLAALDLAGRFHDSLVWL